MRTATMNCANNHAKRSPGASSVPAPTPPALPGKEDRRHARRAMYTPGVRVIPTRYRGVDFRSRNESRWAFLFTLLGQRWQYEPRFFELRNGNYLPDFFLPDANRGNGLWVECKPTYPTEEEAWKAHDLALHTGLEVVVVWGDLRRFINDLCPEDEAGTRSFRFHTTPCLGRCEGCDPRLPRQGEDFGPVSDDVTYLPCRCPRCGTFGFQFEGRGHRICRTHCDPDWTDGDGELLPDAFFERSATVNFLSLRDEKA